MLDVLELRHERIDIDRVENMKFCPVGFPGMPYVLA
jgi:hypothetical protein